VSTPPRAAKIKRPPLTLCRSARRYSLEDKGIGTEKVLKLHSKTHKIFHGKPAPTAINAVFALRDVVLDHVWKKIEADDGSCVYLEVLQSCEAPPEKGFVRATSYLGWKFEKEGDGTKATMLWSLDPGGTFPTFVVNFAMVQQLKLRLDAFKKNFIDKKKPDGSDNGGIWPESDNVFGWKEDGGEDGGEDGYVPAACERASERLATPPQPRVGLRSDPARAQPAPGELEFQERAQASSDGHAGLPQSNR
jgi:hypothetical protein